MYRCIGHLPVQTSLSGSTGLALYQQHRSRLSHRSHSGCAPRSRSILIWYTHSPHVHTKPMQMLI